MLIILLLVFFILLVMGRIVYGSMKNHVSFISLWFSFFAILSQIRIWGMDKADSDAVAFIMFNILAICVSCIVVSYLLKRRSACKQVLNDNKNHSSSIIERIRILVFVLSLVLSVNLIYQTITGQIAFGNLREITYQSERFGRDTYLSIYFKPIIYQVYVNFVRGFIVFDFGLSICETLVYETQIKSLSILNYCLFCFIQLSRIEMVRMVIIFLLCYILSGKRFFRDFLFSRKNRTLRRAVFIALVIIIIVASLRNYSQESLLTIAVKHFTGDFAGSYVAFGKVWSEYNSGEHVIRQGFLPYVESMLGGLSSIIVSVFNYLLGLSNISTNTMINNYTGSNIIDIGLGYSFNAFYTMYCAPLLSGGYFGCLFSSISWGLLLGITNNRFSTNRSVGNMWRYAYVITTIIFGLTNYPLQSIASWVTLGLTFALQRENVRLVYLNLI